MVSHHSLDALRSPTEWFNRWEKDHPTSDRFAAYMDGFCAGRWSAGKWADENEELDRPRRRRRLMYIYLAGVAVGYIVNMFI